MSIQNNIQAIRLQIPDQVKLVCVSKFHSNNKIMDAYNAGERIFGESKVQEMCDKHETLPKDIQWHFIGHLQTNKIKYIVPYVELIHGVDSIKLLEEINKQAQKSDRKVKCLLQIHIANEDTKFGFTAEELVDFLKQDILKNFEHVSVCGLMGMATFTDNKIQIRNEFKSLKSLFNTVKMEFFENKPEFKEISMGMSDDFQIAIDEGSTMVRIGGSIFGARNY